MASWRYCMAKAAAVPPPSKPRPTASASSSTSCRLSASSAPCRASSRATPKTTPSTSEKLRSPAVHDGRTVFDRQHATSRVMRARAWEGCREASTTTRPHERHTHIRYSCTQPADKSRWRATRIYVDAGLGTVRTTGRGGEACSAQRAAFFVCCVVLFKIFILTPGRHTRRTTLFCSLLGRCSVEVLRVVLGTRCQICRTLTFTHGPHVAQASTRASKEPDTDVV